MCLASNLAPMSYHLRFEVWDWRIGDDWLDLGWDRGQKVAFFFETGIRNRLLRLFHKYSSFQLIWNTGRDSGFAWVPTRNLYRAKLKTAVDLLQAVGISAYPQRDSWEWCKNSVTIPASQIGMAHRSSNAPSRWRYRIGAPVIAPVNCGISAARLR